MSQKDRDYYQKNKARIRANARARGWEQMRDPKKLKARYAIRNALKTGKVIKAFCQKCGKVDTRLEFHHPDYNRPLDVVVLCSSCHLNLHKIERGENKYGKD